MGPGNDQGDWGVNWGPSSWRLQFNHCWRE